MEKYNLKNPSVKRIMQEVKEMQSNPSDDFMSLPLEENIFEWQFAIRGPADSEFEGGIYHGRIQLPPEYPLKPPSFMLLTRNGRFETQTKICLSISNYHPEHWQPSWSVRTALVALIAFMPSNPNGALGSLDYSKEERKALAIKSREAAPRFGTPERQKLIDEIHEYMLSKAPSVPEKSSQVGSEENAIKDADLESTPPGAAVVASASSEEEQQNEAEERALVVRNAAPTNGSPNLVVSHAAEQPESSTQPLLQRAGVNHPRVADDRLFNWAALGLTIAIVILLLKKFMKANGFGAVFMDES
uniref:UBC core domain-containing protein n=1 Tax=Kalanchoe fedtschenkoi TaxID=63787 RepID=A0A7N0U500_KALFE